MDRYIGTKIVLAEPEPKDGREGYAVVYEDGYRSWSPKDVFERCYRRVTDAERGLVENGLALPPGMTLQVHQSYRAGYEMIANAAGQRFWWNLATHLIEGPVT